MGTSRLTILFDDPFWIGLYEREDDTEYSVCRIVFGAEPRDQEVYAYLLEHWRTLRFSPPRPGTEHLPPPKSPKRRQREARRMTQAAGIGTKAQQALKLQQVTDLCAFFGNRFHTGVAKAANSVIIAVLKNRRSAGYRGELEGELRV